jgi:hypothetical protein
MAQVRVTQPHPDQLLIEIGRSWLRASLIVVLAAAWTGLWLAGTEGLLSLVVWVGGLFALPMLGVMLARALRAQRRLLVRANGRLLLDQEPLELARVELRMLHMPVTRMPTGYSLSLWVLASAGPEDIPLGRYRTLVDASKISGALEEFVQRANVKQPGRQPS